MNECNAIHETSLGTIIDIIGDVKDLADKNTPYTDSNGKKYFKPSEKYKAKYNNNVDSFKSIAKLDSKLTMVFPILCSRGISIENASMISKAMERHYVGMLQRIFAARQITSGGITSADKFIAQFHQNLDSRLFSLDDVLKLTKVISTDECALTSTQEAAIRNDMMNINYTLPSNINETALCQYTFTEDAVGVRGTRNGNDVNIKISVKNDTDDKGSSNQTLRKIKDMRDIDKSYADFVNKQTPDTDYKKANELMATPMVISFKSSNGLYEVENAVVGVKAKLYPISSEDIIDNISKRLEDRNWITNFIRATTREISFFKDFLFAIDRAKIDALAHSASKKTTDKIWKVLERRAANAKLRKASQSSGSDVRPITTLCISQEEVEYLRKHYNVDMEKISTIRALFDSLNLLAIVIVDESLEVAKFAFDSDDPMWETVSFIHLEREASDNSYKKVVNLMTKIAR